MAFSVLVWAELTTQIHKYNYYCYCRYCQYVICQLLASEEPGWADVLLFCRPIRNGCRFIGDSLQPRRMCVRLETQKTPRRCELAGGPTGSERVSYSHVVQGRSRCCAAVVSCCRIEHQFVETRHVAGSLSNRAHYSRTCGVGHHCQSATSHSWLHFDGLNKFLRCYTWP